MKYQIKHEIANQGCMIAGLDPISNLLNDKSERATTCRLFIDDVIKITLSTLNYEFATVSAPLTKLGDKGYQLPPEYIINLPE